MRSAEGTGAERTRRSGRWGSRRSTASQALVGPGRRGIGIALLLSLLGAAGIGICAESAFDPRRPGDPRAGYDSTGFQTASRRLTTAEGAPADLARLVSQPPLGLPALTEPPAAEQIDLGRRLFYDRRLSANDTISCGMCHVPEQAFTQNELATPVGIEGALVRRNAPALYNVAYRNALFHDGRERALEEQIWSPLLAGNEMGNTSRAALLARIAAVPEYARAFAAVFEDGLSELNLGRALAAYQRALLSANSPFDRWFFGGDPGAVSPAQKRGFRVFNRSGCGRCHTFSNRHALFTDDGFHRTGVAFASAARRSRGVEQLQLAPGVSVALSTPIRLPARADDGRREVTGRSSDQWRYRTPSLRNVALTDPYMHDGSLTSLEAVVEFYNDGGGADPGRDAGLVPLSLSEAEQADLVAFLTALTGDNVAALAADARSVAIGDRQQPDSERGGDG